MSRFETAGPVVAEDLQKGVRDRLRLARESVKLAKTEVNVISASTIQRLEDEDVSTIKLGTLLALGQRYGMEPIDFLKYLFNIGNTLDVLDPARQYLNSLPEDLRPVATNMLKVISDFSLNRKIRDKS